jgi:hypothetical protein
MHRDNAHSLDCPDTDDNSLHELDGGVCVSSASLSPRRPPTCKRGQTGEVRYRTFTSVSEHLAGWPMLLVVAPCRCGAWLYKGYRLSAAVHASRAACPGGYRQTFREQARNTGVGYRHVSSITPFAGYLL